MNHNSKRQSERIVAITVPRIPPTHNQRERQHWALRSKERELWQVEIKTIADPADREWLKAMAKLKKPMDVKIAMTVKRTRDEDGLYACVKPILDAMQRIGFIFEDNPQAISLHVSQQTGKPKTDIFIRARGE